MLDKAVKESQLQLLERILPEGAEVRHMLQMWREIDGRYWGEQLQPCWLTSAIEPYGAVIGSWTPSTRTLNLIPRLFRPDNGLSLLEHEDALAGARAVLLHEATHQAQHQLYEHLNGAKGPRGRWFDLSHRCPAWSRACWDIIQTDDLPYFVPVWHRSSGNLWSPWVPASEDWMTFEKADPAATIDGRQLLDFEDSRSFPVLNLAEIVEEAGLPTETSSGKPIDWSI